MAETQAHAHPGPGRFGRLVRSFVVRIWALLILLVVIWAGYTAIRFLVRTVFEGTPIPPQFLQRKLTVDVDTLNEQVRLAAAGGQPTPVGRYHDVDRWFQSDTHAGCVTSGCHSALPHMQRKEIRAFANFHTTFLSCGMCHDARLQPPVSATWVSTTSGDAIEAPPLLKLARFIETQQEQITREPASAHGTISSLLSAANEFVRDPLLGYLLVQINTSEPGSPVWRMSVAQLALEVPSHARGEYGARITPEGAADVRAQERTLAELSRAYFAAPGDSPERKSVHQKIHQDVLAKPEACLSCHGGEPPRLNYEMLGYSPSYAASLRASPTAHMMQQIRDGQPFYLPRLLEGGNGR